MKRRACRRTERAIGGLLGSGVGLKAVICVFRKETSQDPREVRNTKVYQQEVSFWGGMMAGTHIASEI